MINIIWQHTLIPQADFGMVAAFAIESQINIL